MLKTLNNVLSNLHIYLRNKEIWNGISIDDKSPIVDRIWTQIDQYRICLHKIYKNGNEQKKSFLHNHPWPSAMHIVEGSYKMHVGFSKTNIPPDILSTYILTKGCQYEMPTNNIWHSIEPLDKECFTIMLTGIPWINSKQSSNRNINILSNNSFDSLYNYFLEKYNM